MRTSPQPYHTQFADIQPIVCQVQGEQALDFILQEPERHVLEHLLGKLVEAEIPN